MKIRLERDAEKRGCTNEWTATIFDGPAGVRTGIGRDSNQAMGSLMRANLGLFNIVEIVNIDPLSENPEVTWNKPNDGE